MERSRRAEQSFNVSLEPKAYIFQDIVIFIYLNFHVFFEVGRLKVLEPVELDRDSALRDPRKLVPVITARRHRPPLVSITIGKAGTQFQVSLDRQLAGL